jgi:hypothetical protein
MCRSLNGKTIVIGREKYATYSQEKLQVCGWKFQYFER